MASRYEFPQVSPASTTGERGIASLYHPSRGTLRFRANPKEFNWSYTLNKRVDQTYGGRVIQLLGTRIDDFSFKADCGLGRWAEMNRVAMFMRDVMVAQRNGIPATFEYTTRGWKFNAYVVSIPFADAVEEVLREFEVGLKVQEDVTGLMSRNTLQAEMRRLQDGMGFARSKYNDPRLGQGVPDSQVFDGVGQAIDIGTGVVNTLFSQNFLPRPDALSSLLGGGDQPQAETQQRGEAQ
jgi:hypothetical protein